MNETTCYTMPIKQAQNLFFSENPKKIAMAKAICATCPMTQECLRMALDNHEEYGIFGGMTPKEREVLYEQV